LYTSVFFVGLLDRAHVPMSEANTVQIAVQGVRNKTI